MKCRRGFSFGVVSRAEGLPATNDGPTGNAELGQLSLSPGFLIWDALRFSSDLNQPNPIMEESPYCFAVCVTCVVCFPINSILSGHCGCCSMFKYCFFHIYCNGDIFHCLPFSNFGQEVILIK